MSISIKQEKEFWAFLNEKIDLVDYKYKFLQQAIQRMEQGIQAIYDDSFFNIQNDSWILVIQSEGLMIHGKNWSENQFAEVSEILDLNRFTNYPISGEPILIEKLIEFFGCANFLIEKERIFYRANSVARFPLEGMKIRFGHQMDVTALSLMLQQYYHEEYEGKNDKDISDMSERIARHVEEQTIYVLENSENKITSFCTIINPDIGIFFTDSQHRNKGYGKLILSHCTDLLLQHNEEVFLMTDKKNISSNAACIKAGYSNFYEYGYFRINNSSDNTREP